MPTRLSPALKNYDWGDIIALPDFTGQPRDAKPWAELWFGTHPDGQATVQTGNGIAQLSEIVGELSFLVKLIAVAKPLSIQTHPTIAQAKAGFARENNLGIDRAAFNRVYRDTNSKPELLCALTDFEMLCGFAPIEQSLALAEKNGWLELARHLKLTGLANTVRWALEEKKHKTPTNLPDHLRVIGDLYANTGGVYVALLMNHITLKSGQAMFLEPGNVHSYLSGLAVEVMSSSDNVMRAAFTTKHIDLQEFFATAKIDSHLPTQVVQRNSSDNTVDYVIDNAPFSVQTITVSSPTTIQADHEVELYLCVQGHSGALQQGQACILRRHEVLQLESSSILFRVWGN
ncbi:MAG: mannose-6-phosphate isomerase, class I [Actinobacteria bacterium]|nr:mannose-6-phosphate isomerase, class I [Actinomycetota bacterium]